MDLQVGIECARLHAQGPYKLLVLLNPAAGDGKALEMYKTIAAPIFEAGGFECTLHHTTHAGHASKICSTLPSSVLLGLKSIVIVSGDGLVSEVLNGLNQRSESAAALRTPISVVPAGSGNGLCKSILAKSGMDYGIVEASLAVVTGHSMPLDLANIELEGATPAVPTPFISFLSISWGFVGDVDLGGDFLRQWLGAGRFEQWAKWRMTFPRVYSGSISYLPNKGSSDSGSSTFSMPSLNEPVPSEWTVISGEFVVLWACNCAWMTYNSSPTPGARMDDGLWHLLIVDAPTSEDGSEADAVRGVVAAFGESTSTVGRVISTRAWRIHPGGYRAASTSVSSSTSNSSGGKGAIAIDIAGSMMKKRMHWPADVSDAALEGVSSEVEAEAAMRRLAESLRAEGAADEGGVAGAGVGTEAAGWISVDGECAHYGRVQVEVRAAAGRVIVSSSSWARM
jgi:sphingosine kinase